LTGSRSSPLQASAHKADVRGHAARRRAWPALALLAALLGLVLQPPAAMADFARGASNAAAPVADAANKIDRNAVKPDAPAQLQASTHKRLGTHPGPLPVALPVASFCAAPVFYGTCANTELPEGVHALRSAAIVAQPRAPPISRT